MNKMRRYLNEERKRTSDEANNSTTSPATPPSSTTTPAPILDRVVMSAISTQERFTYADWLGGRRTKRSIPILLFKAAKFTFETASGQWGPSIAVNVLSTIVGKAFDYFGIGSATAAQRKVERKISELKRNSNLMKLFIEAFS